MNFLFALLKRLFLIDLGFLTPSFDLGGDAPPPDPLIGQSALMTAQLGNKALDWYQQVYQNDIRPAQQQQQALTNQVTQQQLSDSQKASQFADQQRGLYTSVYAPEEIRAAADANNYDSNANIVRRMGIVSANTNQAFANARQQSLQQLQRYGLNPNSGAFAETNRRLASDQALAEATGRTGAAFDTMDKAIGLRAGVVNTGRGLQNTANSTLTTGTQAGSAAVAGGNQTNQVGIAGMSAAGQGFGLGIQGNQVAGNLAAQQYGIQSQAASQQGSALGNILGTGLGFALMKSSKQLKEKNQSMDTEGVLSKIDKLPVDRWAYKGDNQLHVGPYAEDMHAKFGVGDGVTIGAGDSGGVALAGLKELNKKVDMMGKAIGLRVDSRMAQ